ncbi:MAG: Fic family protein [Rhodospirillales bacterium]|jgi:Fic family protein|nr:Fic family protein [Acetobacter sp.]
MSKTATGLDLSEAVSYHYDCFPPQLTDYQRLIRPLSSAASALARYDQMLKGMHNSEILLAPLRSQEAVVSSRMEGTISTLDEVLRYEAEKESEEDDVETAYRSEAVEVHLYSYAMRNAQRALKDGAPISNWLLRSVHKQLLGFGRGAHLSPGEFKTEQNYLADRGRRKVLFVPVSPGHLNIFLDKLFIYMNNDDWEILIRTALVRLEFEAIHPFKDGDGRIGRMLIPLVLWQAGAISQPYFYMSGYLGQRRDEYIDRMREVSAHDDWTGWIVFFLEALENQANQNLQKAEEIRSLHEEMKDKFRSVLSSQWITLVLDFMFTRPVFRNNMFTSKSGIPQQTAHRVTRTLSEHNMLRTIVPAAGRRPAMYAFEPLLTIVRD